MVAGFIYDFNCNMYAHGNSKEGILHGSINEDQRKLQLKLHQCRLYHLMHHK